MRSDQCKVQIEEGQRTDAFASGLRSHSSLIAEQILSSTLHFALCTVHFALATFPFALAIQTDRLRTARRLAP